MECRRDYAHAMPLIVPHTMADLDKIRRETGACVLVVHHTGKDEAKGARGHSLLRAAIDTEIAMTRNKDDGLIEIKATKQRDLMMADPVFCKLRSLVVGRDSRGRDVRSGVVVPMERAALGGVAVSAGAGTSNEPESDNPEIRS